MVLTLRKSKTVDINFAEVHQYVEDLQRITLLRDKTVDNYEKERYNNIIKVMQLVLHFLNDKVEGGANG